MSNKYSLEDVTKSYKWLGHRGWTELNAIHHEYKQGKENIKWNIEHKTFARIKYARTELDVVNFVERYAGTYMVCYGLNPRPKIFMNSRGYQRAAREEEIEISQNLLMDFDFQSKNIMNEQVANFELFIQKANKYFLDLGIQPPATAYTGRGYHFLFAFPSIRVSECNDISDRLKEFCAQFRQTFKSDLERLEVKLDNTQDLRRMVKIYGTAKPQVGIVSRFYGGERVEDEALRAYPLQMNLHHASEHHPSVLNTGDDLPSWFQRLITQNAKLQDLWLGRGKPENTDTTRSGYDYSLVKSLMHLGYKNIDELATILALRPDGAVRSSGKSEEYIRRTIANAILK